MEITQTWSLKVDQRSSLTNQCIICLMDSGIGTCPSLDQWRYTLRLAGTMWKEAFFFHCNCWTDRTEAWSCYWSLFGTRWERSVKGWKWSWEMESDGFLMMLLECWIQPHLNPWWSVLATICWTYERICSLFFFSPEVKFELNFCRYNPPNLSLCVFINQLPWSKWGSQRKPELAEVWEKKKHLHPPTPARNAPPLLQRHCHPSWGYAREQETFVMHPYQGLLRPCTDN